MFPTHPADLRSLLDQATLGRLPFPERQRSDVWGDDGFIAARRHALSAAIAARPVNPVMHVDDPEAALNDDPAHVAQEPELELDDG